MERGIAETGNGLLDSAQGVSQKVLNNWLIVMNVRSNDTEDHEATPVVFGAI